jgi:hypothetical protein
MMMMLLWTRHHEEERGNSQKKRTRCTDRALIDSRASCVSCIQVCTDMKALEEHSNSIRAAVIRISSASRWAVQLNQVEYINTAAHDKVGVCIRQAS